MKSFLPTILVAFALVAFFSILSPASALAQSGVGGTGGFGTGATGGVGTGVTGGQGCGTQGSTFVLCNPLGFDNFCDLIKAVLNVLLALGIPIAVLFLVWSGFRFILARGRPTELDSARRNFYYVIIGIGVFLGAWTLASVISATIQQLDKTHTIQVCSRT